MGTGGEFVGGVLNDSLRSRLSAVTVADLCDASCSLGEPVRVANSELRPVVPFSRIIGTAVTMRSYLSPGKYDYHEQIGKFYEQGQSYHSAVVVLRCEVPGLVNWGSGGSRIARAHGYTGAVVDGNVRDSHEIREMAYPVFATGLSACSSGVHGIDRGCSIRIDVGCKVNIAGIEIAQGDIVVGDNDGLIAVSPENIERVLIEAERLAKRGAEVAKKLEEGKKFRDLIDIWRRPGKTENQ